MQLLRIDMVITRKIEVFIPESNDELRKAYRGKLYANRDVAVKVANMAVSHLFALDNTMPYLSDEAKEVIEYLGVRGQKATKQNAPYVAASEAFKGIADMGMVSSILQNVQKMYRDDREKGMWNKSLRSYKSNMPVPYKPDRFLDLRFAKYTDGAGQEKEGCFFSLMGIPFQMRFGTDRSGNRLIVERVISSEYKMCTSSIMIDRSKIFLLLCVDIPRKETMLDGKKTMYALLDVLTPIKCYCDVRTARKEDSGDKYYTIGTKEEFNYRRCQIQEAVRKCQISNRYTAGGKGRKKKCQAIGRWHEKEKNYVETKLHTYSRMLVDLAIKHKCGVIRLVDQKRRETMAKEDNLDGDPFVLRNWSYYGLKKKIAYKCRLAGVKLVQDREKTKDGDSE